ncbi:MAG: hypothetical protein ACXWUM_08375 [Burkholderiaceae bacterium]
MGTTPSGFGRHCDPVIGSEMAEVVGIFRAVGLGALMWATFLLAYWQL